VEALTSVEKAVDVLFALHGAPASLGVTALGHELGLPKSSAHRLLATLTRRGLVERDERGRYQPGIALVGLGLALEQEADALGETVFLVGARARRLYVLDKAEGTGFLRAAPRVGEAVPVHATAAGKLFLAFAPHQVSLPAGALARFTPRTLASRRALERAVETVRAQGFAENRDEWIPGMSVVAAPIFSRGELRGALVVAAPSARVDELGRESTARRMRAGAGRIRARLEGRAQEDAR